MIKKLKYHWPVYFIYLLIFIIFVVLPITGYKFYKSHTYSDEFLEAVDFAYPAQAEKACVDKTNDGLAGEFREETEKGSSFFVKTPANYQATYAHPLLVVFAPSGVPSYWVEKYTGLTRTATESGYIIAYANSRPMSVESILELGTIPKRIADKWCIDTDKVFFTGHSDGGTISSALVFLPESQVKPAAIAPSAAGVRGKDLEVYTCPAPVSVMVMHGKNDDHFPGFGEEAASWWASCNQCQSSKVFESSAGCLIYSDCLENVEVRYCEGSGNHFDWPRINDEMMSFFNSTAKK